MFGSDFLQNFGEYRCNYRNSLKYIFWSCFSTKVLTGFVKFAVADKMNLLVMYRYYIPEVWSDLGSFTVDAAILLNAVAFASFWIVILIDYPLASSCSHPPLPPLTETVSPCRFSKGLPIPKKFPPGSPGYPSWPSAPLGIFLGGGFDGGV